MRTTVTRACPTNVKIFLDVICYRMVCCSLQLFIYVYKRRLMFICFFFSVVDRWQLSLHTFFMLVDRSYGVHLLYLAWLCYLFKSISCTHALIFLVVDSVFIETDLVQSIHNTFAWFFLFFQIISHRCCFIQSLTCAKRPDTRWDNLLMQWSIRSHAYIGCFKKQ